MPQLLDAGESLFLEPVLSMVCGCWRDMLKLPISVYCDA